MSAVIGSDPEQLEQLAAALLAGAERLDEVRSELAFVLVSSPWQGGDAEDFRWQWGHQLAGLLQGASAAFREAGGRVRGNAAQQRQASADDGGQAGAPFAGRAGAGGGSDRVDGFDPLGIAAAFGVTAMRTLGFGAGLVGVVQDAHHGLLKTKWLQNTAHEVVRLADDVRVGGAVPLRIAGEFLSKWALPIDVVNTAIDGVGFAQEAGKNVRSQETFDAGVSTALGVAGVAVGVAGLALGASAVAPLAAGLFAGTVLWEVATEFTPVEEWAHDIGWAVADGVGAVGDGVGDIINGGLNALLGR